MSVVLNAVDLVFMIDGKTAPDTYEQDEHYEEKPEGAAPATGRLSRVSPNALQAISGSEERTQDEPPDHACITTATIASIGGRHASSAWTFQIHRTGNCRTSHFPCDGGTSFRRSPVAEVQLLAGPTQSVCGNPSVGLPVSALRRR
jgi:hypothetical protein